LSDFDRKMSHACGVLRNEGFAERALFLVDKEGVIRYVKVFDIGAVPDTTALQKALAEL
jgi:alkyl hydroperoxide reductase subunit AhpC